MYKNKVDSEDIRNLFCTHLTLTHAACLTNLIYMSIYISLFENKIFYIPHSIISMNSIML